MGDLLLELVLFVIEAMTKRRIPEDSTVSLSIRRRRELRALKERPKRFRWKP